MTPRRYISHDDSEARGLRDGTITLLVIPIEPQPILRPGFTLVVAGRRSTRAIPVCWDCEFHDVPSGGPGHNVLWLRDEAIPLPYVLDDLIEIEAIRTRMVVNSVDAWQLHAIANGDILRLGIVPAECPTGPTRPDFTDGLEQFVDQWDRRHPKLPWAANPWAWFVTVDRQKGT